MLAPIEFAFLCWFIAPSGQLLLCTDRSCLLRPDCVAGDDYCVLYDFAASRERILDRDLRVKNDQDAIDDGRQGHEPPLWPAGSRMPRPRGCGDLVLCCLTEPSLGCPATRIPQFEQKVPIEVERTGRRQSRVLGLCRNMMQPQPS